MQESQDDRERRIGRAEEILHHTFKDRALIQAALTHPSALEEDEGVERGYERLEFLGDSIVGAIVADAIYQRFPKMDEGGMTRIKVSVVAGSTLSEASKRLGMTDCIIFGGSETGTGKRGLHSALENVFESVTAALYLDAGLAVTRQWVLDVLGDLICDDAAAEPISPKSSLQEILQVHRITPTYEIIDVDGPPHDRTFTSVVFSGEDAIGQGSGHSKKEAEAAAAVDAMRRMGHDA